MYSSTTLFTLAMGFFAMQAVHGLPGTSPVPVGLVQGSRTFQKRHDMSPFEKKNVLIERQTCPTGSLACSDGGCCPYSTVCSSVNGVPGCCPIGRTCNSLDTCTDPTLVQCAGLDYCCPIGQACSSVGQHCDDIYGGNSPTTTPRTTTTPVYTTTTPVYTTTPGFTTTTPRNGNTPTTQGGNIAATSNPLGSGADRMGGAGMGVGGIMVLVAGYLAI